ncbi:DUF3667 domain-containing protein [Luteimonas huabeiensis]|uniref:DUF3667 domain-containing protein n=1 Tax=Luteimonas huabeiensis TaxID=1244513 RepID=UPI0004634AC3|nr:DUF3667 domain-containing protein [Luteimonas huabeiensis]
MSHTAHRAGHAAPAACENCGTRLQGGYCHLCGQSAHNPLRHVGHAVEEVFESFWHLDGRVFRTLRDLFVPGRVAVAYLAGHRVRYIAPLRLFVILTALTVFVAKILIAPLAEGPGGADAAPANGAVVEATRGGDAFARADSAEAVERVRAEALADLAQAESLPFAGPALANARKAIDDAADTRLRALGTQPPARPASAAAADDARAAPEPDHPLGATTQRLERNLERIGSDPGSVLRFLIGAAPTTLFLLVPVFALLLKGLYAFSGRSYLEHIVVALYSHAYLMLALLLIFACAGVDGWLAGRAPALSTALGWASTLLGWSMPAYLLWMQRRVYRQSWPRTLAKYAVGGIAYTVLFTFVAAGAIGFSLFAM